jgi:hypothetical protein
VTSLGKPCHLDRRSSYQFDHKKVFLFQNRHPRFGAISTSTVVHSCLRCDAFVFTIGMIRFDILAKSSLGYALMVGSAHAWTFSVRVDGSYSIEDRCCSVLSASCRSSYSWLIYELDRCILECSESAAIHSLENKLIRLRVRCSRSIASRTTFSRPSITADRIVASCTENCSS